MRPSPSPRTPSLILTALSCALCIATSLPGCASAPYRKKLTDAELQSRYESETTRLREVVADTTRAIVDRSWKRVQEAAPGEVVTLNFLAMSGGGDYGAFGAGFLVGWGHASDPASRRPSFDVVTGVSTGALLAPFAYVGTDESCLAVETFYRNPEPNWIEERGLLFFLPSNPSFMIIPKLEQSLKTAITPELVQQMAASARDGRVLAISSTDLDYGQQHYWNLGIESEKAAESGNSDHLRKILLASAAIPVAFPPVEINGSLYVDGGVTANVFVRLDTKSPDSVIQTWRRLHPGAPLPRVRYWVIINNSFTQPPATVEPKWQSILAPSLATAIRSATITEVRWLAAQADFVNATLNTDIEVRVVAIPNEWRPPVPGDFKRKTMDSLADIGRKMGADPTSWELWASPSQLEK